VTPGSRLRAAREGRGLTQRRLGGIVHYDHAYISRVETGQQRPSADFLARVAGALGLSELKQQLRLYWSEDA
jgi:transcriptional regulator with XRE-family HTH domain